MAKETLKIIGEDESLVIKCMTSLVPCYKSLVEVSLVKEMKKSLVDEMKPLVSNEQKIVGENRVKIIG